VQKLRETRNSDIFHASVWSGVFAICTRSFLSKVAFLEESANGMVVWRPFAAGMSGTQHMAVVISSLRMLSLVTRDFVQRLIQRMKQMEAASVL
jgi:hypothetical protein